MDVIFGDSLKCKCVTVGRKAEPVFCAVEFVTPCLTGTGVDRSAGTEQQICFAEGCLLKYDADYIRVECY